MRRLKSLTSVITLAAMTAMALPAVAEPQSFSLEPRLALEAQPRLEASKPLALKSPALSVGLSLATPLAVSSLGGGLLMLSNYPSEVNALGVLGMVVGAAAPLALGTGQAYAGDPQRGLWVGLGTYGALVGTLALGFGVAYAVAPKAMESGGQSAGMSYALLALPIASILSVGYTIWALADAHQTAVRYNEAVTQVEP